MKCLKNGAVSTGRRNTGFPAIEPIDNPTPRALPKASLADGVKVTSARHALVRGVPTQHRWPAVGPVVLSCRGISNDMRQCHRNPSTLRRAAGVSQPTHRSVTVVAVSLLRLMNSRPRS